MAVTKVVVNIDSTVLAELDALVTQHVFPNRSHAIQAAVEEKLTRLRQTPLARECAKLNPIVEQEYAEEGMERESTTWPEY